MSLLQQASCQQEDSQQTREEVSNPVPIPDITEHDKQNIILHEESQAYFMAAKIVFAL